MEDYEAIAEMERQAMAEMDEIQRQREEREMKAEMKERKKEKL